MLGEAIGAPGKVEGCAIVYAPTRRVTEEEADRLARAGWRARAYHAGLGGPTRERAQKTFLNGETDGGLRRRGLAVSWLPTSG